MRGPVGALLVLRWRVVTVPRAIPCLRGGVWTLRTQALLAVWTSRTEPRFETSVWTLRTGRDFRWSTPSTHVTGASLRPPSRRGQAVDFADAECGLRGRKRGLCGRHLDKSAGQECIFASPYNLYYQL